MITDWKKGSAGEGQVLTDVTIMPVQCYPRRERGGGEQYHLAAIAL